MVENNRWRENERSEIISLFESIKGNLSGDIAVNIQLQIDDINTKIGDLQEVTDSEIDSIFTEV